MEELHDEGPDELEILLYAAARQIARGSEPAEFLKWFQFSMPNLAPQLASALSETDGGTGSMIYSLGRSLWNAMPQPSNGYRPRRLPKPDRNGRCPCGSGRKFKQCCAQLEPPDEIFDSLNLLRYVLDYESKAGLKKINARLMDPEAVADVAQQWSRAGEFERALILLEPLFDAGAKLPKQSELLVDVLFDVWPPDCKPQRRWRLAERLSASANPRVACIALHRCIVMLAEKGSMGDAWEMFHDGLRRFPDDVNFAGLEITLLLTENRLDDAKRRAEFWSHQLKRKGPEYDAYAERLVAMADSSEDHDSLSHLRNESPLIDSFARLFQDIPIEMDGYQPHTAEVDEPIVLTPSSKLAAIERLWAENVGGSKPSLIELESDHEPLSIDQMIYLVEKDPYLVHSFDVLDDISESLEASLDAWPEFGLLLVLVLQRAETLLFSIITGKVPEKWVTAETWREALPTLVREVPWGFLENRPALRLMARHIHHLKYGSVGRSEHWLPRATVLLKINPNDNHGYRDLVSSELLSLGQADAALNVLDQYPEDAMGAMRMNRVLALFVLKRHEEAERCLRDGGSQLREIRKAITHKRYAKPRNMRDYSITIGGRDEAWLYRQDMHSTWDEAGAIEWLKQQPIARQTRKPQPTAGPNTASDHQGGQAESLVEEPGMSSGFNDNLSVKPSLLEHEQLQSSIDELGAHGAWMLGLTLAAALTPSFGFEPGRLFRPVLERFDSDVELEQNPASTAPFDEPENDVNQSATVEISSEGGDSLERLNQALHQFLRLYHHFLIRLDGVIDSTGEPRAIDAEHADSLIDSEFSSDWIREDLSVLPLEKHETRQALVGGLVNGIDGNPRGWSSIPTGPRNTVIGPLRLMEASSNNGSELADSALPNLALLDPDDTSFQLNRDECIQAIVELVKLAQLSRR